MAFGDGASAPDGIIELTDVHASEHGRVRLLFTEDGWVEVEDRRDWGFSLGVATFGALIVGLIFLLTGLVSAAWVCFGIVALILLGFALGRLLKFFALALGGAVNSTSQWERRQHRRQFLRELTQLRTTDVHSVAMLHPEARPYLGAEISRVDFADVQEKVLVTVWLGENRWAQYRADRATGREILDELARLRQP